MKAWNFMIETMCEQLGKDKKHKKKVDKLKMLPESYSVKFLDEYFERAKLMHKMKILLEKHSVKSKVKDPLIESIKEKIKEKDKLLGKKESTHSSKHSPPKQVKPAAIIPAGSVKP